MVRHRGRSLRWPRLWAMAAMVCVAWPTVTRAAPRVEEQLRAAETAMSQGRFSEAAELFHEVYDNLSVDARAGGVGEQVVVAAADAHDKAWLEGNDVEQLVAARDLLRAHARDRTASGAPNSAEVDAQIARLDTLIARLPRKSDEVVLKVDDDPPSVPDPIMSQPKAAPEKVRPDATSIGLISAGAVAAVGGVVMLGVGSQIPDRARQKLDDRGGMTPEDGAFLSDAEDLGTGLMIGGAAVAVLGIAGVLWGSIRATAGPLKRRRSRRRAAVVLPAPRAGIVIIGRF